MTRYFKVKLGYGKSEYISVGERDAEVAMYAFLNPTARVVLSGKPVRGQDIITIEEDWHREMGWNPTHQLQGEDWNELKSKGVTEKYAGAMEVIKNRVKYFVESGKLELLGTGVEVHGVTASTGTAAAMAMASEMQQLGQSKKIK